MNPTEIIVAGLLAASLGMSRPDTHPPEAKAEVIIISDPAPGGVIVRGNATWYDYVRGGAAAGPALRKALGKHWRGTTVDACVGSTCVTVKLSDWCLCSKGNRVIDLDDRSFRQLAPLSRGITGVTIRR